MNEITVKLTEKEIELLMYATQAHAAHEKLEALQGRRDKKKTKAHTDRLCEVNSKLYQIILKVHEKEAAEALEYKYAK